MTGTYVIPRRIVPSSEKLYFVDSRSHLKTFAIRLRYFFKVALPRLLFSFRGKTSLFIYSILHEHFRNYVVFKLGSLCCNG